MGNSNENWVYSSFSDRQAEAIYRHKWEGESITDTFFRLMSHLRRAIAEGSAPPFPSVIGERPRHSFWYSKEVERLCAGNRTTKRTIVWALELAVQTPVTSPEALIKLMHQEFPAKTQVSVRKFLDFVRIYTPIKRTGVFKSGLLGELRSRRLIVPVTGKDGYSQVTIPLPGIEVVTASGVRRLLCLSPRGKRAGEIKEFIDRLPVQILKKDGEIAGVLALQWQIPSDLAPETQVNLADYTLPEFGKVWRRFNGSGLSSLKKKGAISLTMRGSQRIFYLSPEEYRDQFNPGTRK